MSGHSKWHTIKHKKGAADAKRGKIFTRIIKELTIAARHGGGDPDMNPRLRTIIADAKAVNMPADNIKRAIERATGAGKDVEYEEIVYEGYGPGGVAVLVEAQTDNRNRTASDVRSIFSKTGGQLAGTGAVCLACTTISELSTSRLMRKPPPPFVVAQTRTCTTPGSFATTFARSSSCRRITGASSVIWDSLRKAVYTNPTSAVTQRAVVEWTVSFRSRF